MAGTSTDRFARTGALSRIKKTPSPEKVPFRDEFYVKSTFASELATSPRAYASPMRSLSPRAFERPGMATHDSRYPTSKPAYAKRLGPGSYTPDANKPDTNKPAPLGGASGRLAGSGKLASTHYSSSSSSSVAGENLGSRSFTAPARRYADWQLYPSSHNPDTSDIYVRDKQAWGLSRVFLPRTQRFHPVGLYSTKGLRACEMSGMNSRATNGLANPLTEAGSAGRRPAFRPEASDAMYDVGPHFSGTISQSVAVSPLRYSHVFASNEPRLSPLPRSRALIPEPASVQTCDRRVGPGTYGPPVTMSVIPGVPLFPHTGSASSSRPGTAPVSLAPSPRRSPRARTVAPLPTGPLARSPRSSRAHSQPTALNGSLTARSFGSPTRSLDL